LGVDEKDAKPILGAKKLGHHRAQDSGGRGDAKCGEQVRQRGAHPDLNQLVDLPTSEDADEVEGRRVCAAKSENRADQRREEDRERGQYDAWRVACKQDRQQRADRYDWQTEGDNAELEDWPREPWNKDRRNSKDDRRAVTPKPTQRRASKCRNCAGEIEARPVIGELSRDL
jgi:hypothetical protein